MNFFDQQDRVKRRTGMLIFFFAVAVALIVAAVNCVAYGFHVFVIQSRYPFSNLDHVLVSLITLALILGSSIIGIYEMGGGGAAVAKKLGGRLIPPNTRQPDEIKVRNVVEEMAIASGIPVPDVFVFPGLEINAFAAGVQPQASAVAVSQGAITLLNREELQAVVAHEFSHIFNGDMRLNIRLIGLLNGILMLAIIGRVLLRTRGRRNPLPLLGLALFVIGYAGVFMARIIKSAVARQREFLADASAVQFTRNPAGLVGALQKIAQSTSLVSDPRAEELSHLFFAKGTRSFWDALFDTHPPLEERIQAIDPSHPLDFTPLSTQPLPRSAPQPTGAKAAFASHTSASVAPATVAQSVAVVSPSGLALAAQLKESFPPSLRDNVLNGPAARWVVAGLLLSSQSIVRARQLDLLGGEEPEALAIAQEVEHYFNQTNHPSKLPILEWALPALQQLSETEKEHFQRLVQDLVRMDNRVNALEFAVEVLLSKSLLPSIPPVVGEGDLADSLCLLSYLAYAGHPGRADAAEHAFKKGMAEFTDGPPKSIWPWDQCGPEEARRAIFRLALLSPLKKKKLVMGLYAAASADGTVRPDEWEIFRAVCHCLEVPIPLEPPTTPHFHQFNT